MAVVRRGVSSFHKRQRCAKEDERQHLREQMTEKMIDEKRIYGETILQKKNILFSTQI